MEGDWGYARRSRLWPLGGSRDSENFTSFNVCKMCSWVFQNVSKGRQTFLGLSGSFFFYDWGQVIYFPRDEVSMNEKLLFIVIIFIFPVLWKTGFCNISMSLSRGDSRREQIWTLSSFKSFHLSPTKVSLHSIILICPLITPSMNIAGGYNYQMPLCIVKRK